MNNLIYRLRAVALGLTVFLVFNTNGALEHATVNALSQSDFPPIELAQTANMRVVILGVPSDYVDESSFLSRITRSVSQFAHPNNMTWNLNGSIAFYEFPMEVMNSLINNAYQSGGISYYNITLLDASLSQLEYLAIPKRGYLVVFMLIPDNGVRHSWFYVHERPDLFLGRTDFFDGEPSKYWEFPPYFGGLRRALYFDLSDVIERTPIKNVVTDTAIKLFNNGLVDVFADLLGATDSRMIAADMQRYENYEVRILWLNGTDNQVNLERIEKAFEDLMPWTNWTITVQTKPMDDGLNGLIANRTVKLSKPLSYSFSLANGSRFFIQGNRNVVWEVFKDSGEFDPISQYMFGHVEEHFNLTDTGDKSIIPVVYLQLRNDTAIGEAPGLGLGTSWFPYNVVIMGCQGGTVATIGESGPILLTHLLRHEIGHWVSLSHHSARFDLGYPKVICSMRSITNRFCAFCKDARARMSYMSYYEAITELFSNSTDLLNRYGNQESLNSVRSKLSSSVQLFYDWDYVESVQTLKQAYHQTEDFIKEAQNQVFLYTRVVPIALTLVATAVVLAITFIKLRVRRNMEQVKKSPF